MKIPLCVNTYTIFIYFQLVLSEHKHFNATIYVCVEYVVCMAGGFTCIEAIPIESKSHISISVSIQTRDTIDIDLNLYVFHVYDVIDS